MQDSQEQAKRARDRGTAIHAAIQGYLQNEKPDPALMPHVIGAMAAIDEVLFQNGTRPSRKARSHIRSASAGRWT
jgi:hypothetical protein